MTNIGHKKKYTAPQTEILPADTNVCLLRGSWSVEYTNSNPPPPTEEGIQADLDNNYGNAVNTWNSDPSD